MLLAYKETSEQKLRRKVDHASNMHASNSYDVWCKASGLPQVEEDVSTKAGFLSKSERTVGGRQLSFHHFLGRDVALSRLMKWVKLCGAIGCLPDLKVHHVPPPLYTGCFSS
jgi:hypothetical protein